MIPFRFKIKWWYFLQKIGLRKPKPLTLEQLEKALKEIQKEIQK